MITDAAFAGYLFDGPPPALHRLWFLESRLSSLMIFGRHTIFANDIGQWTADVPWHFRHTIPYGDPLGQLRNSMPGLCLRYESLEKKRSLVWRLTDDVIETDNDVWRLGLWPD